MGQYKFSMDLVLQFGISIRYRDKQLIISIPFILICVGLEKHANGYNIFGKYFK